MIASSVKRVSERPSTLPRTGVGSVAARNSPLQADRMRLIMRESVDDRQRHVEAGLVERIVLRSHVCQPVRIGAHLFPCKQGNEQRKHGTKSKRLQVERPEKLGKAVGDYAPGRKQPGTLLKRNMEKGVMNSPCRWQQVWLFQRTVGASRFLAKPMLVARSASRGGAGQPHELFQSAPAQVSGACRRASLEVRARANIWAARSVTNLLRRSVDPTTKRCIGTATRERGGRMCN